MRFRDIGLSTRITFWVLLFVVAGGVLWMDKESEHRQEAFLKERSADIEAALDVEQAHMKQAIEAMRQDVVFLANTPPISGIVRASANGGTDLRDKNSYAQWEARLQDIFTAYLRAHPEYFQVRYIAAAGEGHELVRVSSENGRVEASTHEMLQAEGGQDYFRAGLMLAAGRVHLSEFALSRDRGDGANRPTIRAVTTVYDASGRVFGMVVINRDARSLFTSGEAKLPHGVRSYIADQYGRYLHHPDAKRAFMFESGNKEVISDEFPALRPLLDPQNKDDALPFQPTGDGLGGYVVAKRLYFDASNPSRFLVLAFHLPVHAGIREAADLPIPNLNEALLVMFGVSAVFMLMLRHTFAPLRRITAAARKIAAGQRDIRLKEGGKAEIGELARALNVMLDKLSDSDLIEKENELRRSILETTHDGYLLIDALGSVEQANQAYANLSGYSMDELPGMHLSQLEAKEKSTDEVVEHLVGIIDLGSEVFETRHRHKAGHEVDVEASITYLPELQKFVAFYRDITERKKVQAAQQRYQHVIETAMDGYWMTDMDGYLEEANEAYARMSGYTVDELVGMHISELEAQETAQETREHIEKLMLTGYDRFETKHRRKDGRVVDIEISATYMQDNEKLVVFCHNITKRKQSEQDLRVAAATFETHEAILITDAQANIIRVNSAFTAITGYTSDEVIGKNPRLMSSGRHDKEFYAAMWQRIHETGSWAGEIWDKRKNGEIYPKWMTITAVKNERNETTQYVAIFSDITERKRAEEEIRSLAFYDVLTALPNRRLFMERFHTAMASAVRYEDFGAVLFIDLDRFKQLNDTLGHDYGDLLLIEVAARIKSCVREIDTVSRFGGDEFVVLLESVSGNRMEAARKAGVVAEKIREVLAQPYQLKEHEYLSSPSIGVSMYYGNGDTVEVLLKQADAAMYRSKEAGRNAVRFFDDDLQRYWEAGAPGAAPEQDTTWE